MNKLTDKDVEWVVNDLGELGVKVGDQFFFLYKGESLVYQSARHRNGTPLRWRPVYKREFGEVCRPEGYIREAWNEQLTWHKWAVLPTVVSEVEQVRRCNRHHDCDIADAFQMEVTGHLATHCPGPNCGPACPPPTNTKGI